MPTPHTRRRWLTLAASVIAGNSLRAQAQPSGWPAKPVRIVVAYPPGGVSDVVARALAEQLAARLGVPVLVENKAGASGALGVNAVAKSAPDGYTLAFSAISPLTLSPQLGPSPFDPVRDIAPVAGVMYSPVLIVATAASKESDLQGLLAGARARPGSVRWATSGPASLGHVVLEQVRAAARVDITHVPYKGGGRRSPTRSAASSKCCRSMPRPRCCSTSRPVSCGRWPSAHRRGWPGYPPSPPWLSSATLQPT